MAAAAANEIPINNATRLARFEHDLDTNYNDNERWPEYRAIKAHHLGILQAQENLARNHMEYGNLIRNAYLAIWGKTINAQHQWVDIPGRRQYSQINNIPEPMLKRLNIRKSGIRIRLNNTNRFIGVASYGNNEPKIPKGDREFRANHYNIEEPFDAAKRELAEETGIDGTVFDRLNEREHPEPIKEGYVHVYTYYVDEPEYERLVQHMRDHANMVQLENGNFENVEGRTADVTTIYYKKYMKYKAKYLALVKSMGK
jgi:ADP-ribose pyrophosphatase YjhB (NUDIX family)